MTTKDEKLDNICEKYESLVSVEIHTQLKTRSKLFCRCANSYGAPPNSVVCPTCLGLPGSLPALNEKAVELGTMAALALGSHINMHSSFDRKNYFYPDLPKSYQITQHFAPLAIGGSLEFEKKGGRDRVEIERMHIEEDAGKTVYDEKTGESLIDFNRCGVPLLEIVTKPASLGPDEVYSLLNAARRLLRYLMISDCDMEKGNLRCDVNVSVMPCGSEKPGTRTEIKNLNSFRAVKQALAYEKKRQVGIVESGGRVKLETLLWDASSGTTALQRSKEKSNDYRYFPEPDLPPLILCEDVLHDIKASIPEFPSARIRRFMETYSLPLQTAELLVRDKELADYFENALRYYDNAIVLANWISGHLMKEMNERSKSIVSLELQPEHLAQIAELAGSGKITVVSAKNLLSKTIDTGQSPSDLLSKNDFSIESDENTLRELVIRAISLNATASRDYRAGKTESLQFLLGQVMKLSSGRADPLKASKIIEEMLEN